MKVKNIILGVVVLSIIAGGVIYSQVPKSKDVRTSKVIKGSVAEIVEVEGKVVLENKETVYSRLQGFVQDIGFKEGDMVEAGALLLNVDVKDIELQIQKAKAAYDISLAALEETKKGIKPEQIRQAEAVVEQAKTSLEQAQKDYAYKKDKLDYAKALLEKNSISGQEYKDMEYMANQADLSIKDARERLSSAESNLNLLNKGVSKELITQAENNVTQAKLTVDELLNNKGKARIFAGIKGTILSKSIERGMSLQPGTPICEIGDNSSAYISARVLVDDAAKIKIGQRVRLKGDVLGDTQALGEVYFIAPKAEDVMSSLGINQARLEVRIKIDNEKYKLRPGFTLDTEIMTTEKSDVLLVPDKSLFEYEGEKQVFVVVNGVAELRKVKKGISDKDNVEITEGLKEGENVVFEPDSSLKPGNRVKN